MKGYNGQLGISQQSTLVMHSSKVGQTDKGIKTDLRGGAFPGQKIDILKYGEQNANQQECTAGHMDNAGYAGVATILSELCSKFDIMPYSYMLIFPKPENYAENYAKVLCRQ